MIPLPSDGSVSVAGRTPRLDVEAVEAVVTLPTFKRPEQVLETLASLRAQQTGRRFAVIVMENEAEARAGAKAVLPLFERGEMPGLVIIAHERGNCSAYNAGWQTAILQFPNFRHL
ncbi:glycosyltransferase, partial [Mesorhizobium sp. M7A.F.Ca.AU.001.01.1.1]